MSPGGQEGKKVRERETSRLVPSLCIYTESRHVCYILCMQTTSGFYRVIRETSRIRHGFEVASVSHGNWIVGVLFFHEFCIHNRRIT